MLLQECSSGLTAVELVQVLSHIGAGIVELLGEHPGVEKGPPVASVLNAVVQKPPRPFLPVQQRKLAEEGIYITTSVIIVEDGRRSGRFLDN